ncbi:terpene synthase [Ceratobasidium sp. AG-Ba]|nr:terpene synthase [Ceratobasidium sp. AG-Ba]
MALYLQTGNIGQASAPQETARNMPKHKLIDRSAFPSKIRMPNLVQMTGKYLKTKINPHWKQAEEGSYKWFESYGIHSDQKLQKFFNTEFGLMGALAFPDADLEHLRPAMDFVLWLFTFDDLTDTEGLRDDINGVENAVNEVMDVLRNPNVAQPKFIAAQMLQSFYGRIQADSTEATIQRLIEACEGYTQATLKQTMNRSFDDLPTIDEFIQLRRETSAMKVFYPILEYSLSLDLPVEVFTDPVMAELLVAANDLLTWANDVYSFPIEQSRGDTHNLVFIVMWNEGLDLESAMDYMDKLMQKRLQEYLDAKAQLRSFGPKVDSQLVSYIQGVEYCVQGSIAWTFMTPRYFGSDAEKVRETSIADIMIPESLAPLVTA